MAYEPRGKVADLLEAMRTSRLEVWDADLVARTMQILRSNIQGHLQAVLKNQLLYQRLENGRSEFSLRPFPSKAPAPAKWTASTPSPAAAAAAAPPAATTPPPITVRTPAPPAPAVEPVPAATTADETADDGAEDEPEIRWTIWDDGDLVVYGVEVNEDGSFTIPAAVLGRIKARIAWSPLQ